MTENSRETQAYKTAETPGDPAPAGNSPAAARQTPVRQNYMLGIGFILIAAFCFP